MNALVKDSCNPLGHHRELRSGAKTMSIGDEKP